MQNPSGPDDRATSASGRGCGASRREFLRFAGGAGAAAVVGGPLARVTKAAPLSEAELQSLVPVDKNLKPAWVQSLFDRGERTVYTGSDLELIGMPVGGIGAGQLYLGGDGRLWHWDIFNRYVRTAGEHYAHPMKPDRVLEQGFAVRVTSGEKSQVRTLDRTGFSDVRFCGEYPIASVEYADPACPVAVSLEAFSPFIPLDTDDSSLPATVMRFTVRNTADEPQRVELAGWMENLVLNSDRQPGPRRRNAVRREGGSLLLECSASDAPASNRPDIVFEDFEKPTYEGWTATGDAFGPGPIRRSQIPAYQGDVGAHGDALVNSHNVRHGESLNDGDAHTGTLTSKPFVIERRYITMLIGGGARPGKECVNLKIDGKVVRSLTGNNSNRMRSASMDVTDFAGKQAQLEIVDAAGQPWGNIGVDWIVFSDYSKEAEVLSRASLGTMGLALLNTGPGDRGTAALVGGQPPAADRWPAMQGVDHAAGAMQGKLVGALTRAFTLGAHESASADFVVAWCFPNLVLRGLDTGGGRQYGKRFKSAGEVAGYVAANFERLTTQTRLWHTTWYDSTLPHWFLDRTFVNTSTLATSTCYRFANGRFYGWEGVGSCPGTCAHVWQYAQAVGRLFPDLERSVREHADFASGVGFNDKTGGIGYRAEFDHSVATDGQAGRILCAYREHQMSAEDAFLKRNWPHIKKATQYLINRDGNGDGLLEDGQHNTLDAMWFGPVSWLSSLYVASVAAAERMAIDAGDDDFAQQCRAIVEAGHRSILTLFNGEYFYQKRDPKYPSAIGSGIGCEIDQVYGQSWANQVALGEIVPAAPARKALESLWKYNFAPDAGAYHTAHRTGRWFAMPGETGLLMCTFPRGGAREANGGGPDWATGYFNECMTGFEHQVAGHMIGAGMLTEGLAIVRAIHDRYHPSRRNPFNEIECGDHYARAMASYGVFIAACGFEVHGPRGHIGFAPRLGPDEFRAAFTAPEGWGTFAQKHTAAGLDASIELKFGRLRVRTLSLAMPPGRKLGGAAVTVGGPLASKAKAEDGRVTITLASPLQLTAGQRLDIKLT